MVSPPLAMGLVLAVSDASNMLAVEHHHSRRPHFADRNGNIIRFKVHAPAGIFNEMASETERYGIERRKLYAVVRRKSAESYLPHGLLPKPFAEPGGLAMAVVEEAAVTVDAGIGPFLKHPYDAVSEQRRRKF
jgi:hypothetical protein